MKKRVLSLLLALCLLLPALPLPAAAAESYLWPVPNVSPNSHISAGYNADGQGSICITGGGNILAAKTGTVEHVYSGCRNSAGYRSGGSSCGSATGCTAPQKQTIGGKQFCNYGYGNGLLVRHDDGGYAFYGHMASVTAAKGARVSQGQALGTMGASGCSTGSHLYFILCGGVKKSGSYYSPTSPINSQTLSYITEVPKPGFTVTFDPMGGTADYTSKTVSAGGTYGSLPNASRTGYLFLGWFPAEDSAAVTSESPLSTQGDHTLFAKWGWVSYPVTFDPNGGEMAGTQAEYAYGKPYGFLPTPRREGYAFEGWYTQPEGGSLITQESSMSIAAPHTLYAHWGQSQAETYMVRFDCQGGTVQVPGQGERESFSRQMAFGEAFHELPEPVRAGYVFLGWYTQPAGGERIYASTLFDRHAEAAYYAQWQAAAETFTVTFNAAGGAVSPVSKTVTNGSAYGELPVPTRSGYRFEGWYTSAAGGEPITEGAIVTLTQNQTLFAHWTAQGKTPTHEGLHYSFGNSRSAYGYSASYRIPLERYQLIFGNTARAQAFYKSSGVWGGNCFGMSSTSAMFFAEGSGVDTSSFRSGAGLPSQLATGDRNSAWGLSVRDFIEAMQISQFDNSIQQDYQNKQGDLDGLVQAVESFRATGKDPVVVAVFGPEGGHAIVGYQIVPVNSTQDDLIVYDCNYPNSTNRAIRLTKNSAGHYTGWYYHLNDTYHWGSSYSGCRISYVPYAHYLSMWNNRQGANTVNLLTLNTRDAVIRDSDGQVAATLQNGQLLTDREDIFPMVNLGLTTDEAAPKDNGTALWLPADGMYSIVNQDPELDRFEATMVHVEQSAAVATSGGEITLAVDDGQELNFVELLPDSEYEVSLSSTLDAGPKDVKLKGTAQGSLALAQVGGSLFGKGVDSTARLTVDGSAVPAQTLTGGWSDVSDLLGSQKMPFTDVPEGAWFYEPIREVYRLGLMTGTSAKLFAPNAKFTRAQAVTVLWQMAGKPAPDGSVSRYTDVPANAWYAKQVAWAYRSGIVSGTSPTTFGPNGFITRQDFALMLYSYAKTMGYDVLAGADLSGFRDAGQISTYARPAVEWACHTELLSGKSGGLIDPKGLTSRAEAAAILRKFTSMTLA